MACCPDFHVRLLPFTYLLALRRYLELCISSFSRPGLHFLLLPPQPAGIPGPLNLCLMVHPRPQLINAHCPRGFPVTFSVISAGSLLGTFGSMIWVVSPYNMGTGSSHVPCMALQQGRLQARQLMEFIYLIWK